jgi:hypothetical protein
MARIADSISKKTFQALTKFAESLPEVPTTQFRLKYIKPNGNYTVSEFVEEEDMLNALSAAHLSEDGFNVSWYKRLHKHTWKEIERWKKGKLVYQRRNR